jgi:ferredoxin/flavodoxin---NADP+ reductase
VHVDEVIGLARRGPAEIKFTTVELQTVVANLDLAAYRAELERVKPIMQAAGQDPSHPLAMMESALAHVTPSAENSRLRLKFLQSPTRILGNFAGQVCGLEVEDNTLVLSPDGEVKARGLGTRHEYEVDTVIFAIGDRVDEQFGLPVQGNEFPRNPQPLYPVGGISYEAFDPASGQAIPGVFVAGWSRQASTGLVGLARKDGMQGAAALLQYLGGLPDAADLSLAALNERLAGLKRPVIRKADLARLEAFEQARAAELGLEEFKLDTNKEMLEAIGAGRVMSNA